MIRLLNARTYQFREFHDNIPPYAIFSHTWTEDEVTFQDFIDLKRSQFSHRPTEGFEIQPLQKMKERTGYKKLSRFLSLFKDRKDLGWVWVDSCCIDKSSSAELSESIVSMFRWYQEATVCIAYLSDVARKEDLKEAKWFTRGWTLQELLAPREVVFYDHNYSQNWTRNELQNEIESITGISHILMEGPIELDNVESDDVWTWSRGRKTTRPEDLAYCLLGLFGVSMAVIYGEGEKNAFRRLRLELPRAEQDRREEAETKAASLAKDQERLQVQRAQSELTRDKSVTLKESNQKNEPDLGATNERTWKGHGEEVRRFSESLRHSNQSKIDNHARTMKEHQEKVAKSIRDEIDRIMGR
jgi:hypothetical protein